MNVVVGIVIALVLAQVIDGRVAFFVGAGTALAVDSWRAGRRGIAEYLGIAGATALGVAVFFVLIGISLFQSSAVLAWVALLLGLATTFVLTTWWTRRQRESAAMKELGMPPDQARGVLEQLQRSDREGAMNAIGAWQEAQRAAIEEIGLDAAALEPEVGKLVAWDKIARQVFRVLSFDRTDTTIDQGGRVNATSLGRPYGFLRVESPILNQPIRLPIIHRDDFALAASVYDDAQLANHVNDRFELLVTYAPERMLPGGVSGSPEHCLHYVICPRGTLEQYYPNSLEGDSRMARPTPETLFGAFAYHGQIQVGRNPNPAF